MLAVAWSDLYNGLGFAISRLGTGCRCLEVVLARQSEFWNHRDHTAIATIFVFMNSKP
jgi:hypothetical protein